MDQKSNVTLKRTKRGVYTVVGLSQVPPFSSPVDVGLSNAYVCEYAVA
jgi:hypothetical protein